MRARKPGSRRSRHARLLLVALFTGLAILAQIGPFQVGSISGAQEKSVTLEASQDTWVDASLPEADHSSEPGLVARFAPPAESRALIGFDLGDLAPSQVRGARLELSLIAAEGQAPLQMAVSGLRGPWEESVAWPDQPPRTATSDIAEVGLEPGPVTWEVTSLAREPDLVQGSVVGFAVSGPFGPQTPSYARTFGSREGEAAATLELTVDPAADEPPSQREEAPGSGNVRTILTVVTGVLLVVILAAWIFSLVRRVRARTEG